MDDSGNYQMLHLPEHEAIGSGTGICPGRVVWDYCPDAVNWDGSGYWWEPEHFSEKTILAMVRRCILVLSGTENIAEGWEKLFTYRNRLRGKGDVGYRQGEKIAIKVNMNGAGGYDGDTTGITRFGFMNPVLLKSLLISLVLDAGVTPGDITVYDASRLFPQFMIEMIEQGILQGIHISFRDENGEHDAVADKKTVIRWSNDFEGDINYLPVCVTEAEYLINMANLKGHPYGVTLCAKNHFGTLMNSSRYRPPEAANIHQFMEQREMNKYTVLVDLMSNTHLHDKTVLYLLDALICASHVMNDITLENASWKQTPFNNGLTSSIFMSQDPVAIDSVGMDFLVNEPVIYIYNSALRDNYGVENYLHEAALIGKSPSGTVYLNGEGQKRSNIGVHEHWNNRNDKQYGRNMGKAEGIELVRTGKGY